MDLLASVIQVCGVLLVLAGIAIVNPFVAAGLAVFVVGLALERLAPAPAQIDDEVR